MGNSLSGDVGGALAAAVAEQQQKSQMMMRQLSQLCGHVSLEPTSLEQQQQETLFKLQKQQQQPGDQDNPHLSANRLIHSESSLTPESRSASTLKIPERTRKRRRFLCCQGMYVFFYVQICMHFSNSLECTTQHGTFDVYIKKS